jgi:hypothetical protein
MVFYLYSIVVRLQPGFMSSHVFSTTDCFYQLFKVFICLAYLNIDVSETESIVDDDYKNMIAWCRFAWASILWTIHIHAKLWYHSTFTDKPNILVYIERIGYGIRVTSLMIWDVLDTRLYPVLLLELQSKSQIERSNITYMCLDISSWSFVWWWARVLNDLPP